MAWGQNINCFHTVISQVLPQNNQMQHISYTREPTHLSSHLQWHKRTSQWLLQKKKKKKGNIKKMILAMQLKPPDNKCSFFCSSNIQLIWIYWPNMTIALICPNSGTFRGFPCIAELSPALSRSRTKFSEYCWILDTLKISLNVAITLPLLLLTRWRRKNILRLDVFDGELSAVFTHL